MKFNIGLAWIPIATVVCIFAGIISSYAIAASLKHVPAVFPFISHTANLPPERSVFQLALTFGSFFGSYLSFIRYKLVDGYFAQHPSAVSPHLVRFNFAALIIGAAAAISFSIVGIFESTSVRVIHSIGVVLSVGGFVTYAWMQVVLSIFTKPINPLSSPRPTTGPSQDQTNVRTWWSPVAMIVAGQVKPLSGRCTIAVRAAIAAFATLTTIAFTVCINIYHSISDELFVWNSTDPGYVSYITGSSFEWATSIAILIFMLTFVPEFYRVNLQVVLIPRSTPPEPQVTVTNQAKIGQPSYVYRHAAIERDNITNYGPDFRLKSTVPVVRERPIYNDRRFNLFFPRALPYNYYQNY